MPREARGSRRTPLIVTDFGGIVDTDPYGRATGRYGADPSTMALPHRCLSCNLVYDGGKVTIIARHADCSVWKCPGCDRIHDDRRAWNGSPGRRMGYIDLNEARRQ